MLVCKKCCGTSYVKSGHIRGIQRYKCQDCGCQFTDTKIRGVSPILRKVAVVLYAHCGVPMLGIAKLFKVSDVAVLKWIRKAASLIPDPGETEKPKAQTVQVDEMWHFVNGKKTLYGSGEPLMGYHVELFPGHWVLVATKT